MLFTNSLYGIKSLENSDTTFILAVLELNEKHPIFEGHFPGQPVLPGVCMVQAVSDVLQAALGREYLLQSATNIKFTNIVNPLEHKILRLEIKIQKKEDSSLVVDATADRNMENCLKMKAVYA